MGIPLDERLYFKNLVTESISKSCKIDWTFIIYKENRDFSETIHKTLNISLIHPYL